MDKAVTNKRGKYAPLVHIAAMQELRKQRPGQVKFYAAAASHSGELAPDYFDLIEWLVGHKRRHARKGGTDYDGRRMQTVTADFRKRLKDGVQCITAAAIGGIMASAGYWTAAAGPGAA